MMTTTNLFMGDKSIRNKGQQSFWYVTHLLDLIYLVQILSKYLKGNESITYNPHSREINQNQKIRERNHTFTKQSVYN